MTEVVVLHRNVDLDAIVSAYLYALKDMFEYVVAPSFIGLGNVVTPLFIELGDVVVTTEEYFEEVFRFVEKIDKITVLDMPLKEEIKSKAEELGVEIEHYDHHDGSAPSTARILWEKFGDELPEWAKYLVELADYSDTGKVLRLPAPVKYFHLTGYINALRAWGYDDIGVMHRIFDVLDVYVTMLKKLVEAEKLIEDVRIIGIGDEYKVAIVENKPSTVNQILFEHKNVDFIIFKDGNNLGITRNALIDEPDLNKLRPHLEKMLKEKGKPEEFKEWFFHPAGFLVARGTRKHPAKTPSVLNPHDLVSLLANL